MVIFIPFSVSTVEKYFGQILTTFAGPGYHSSWKSWKSGPEDSILHSKHTDTLWEAILISRQYCRKMFRSSFDDFSKPKYHSSCQSWKSGSEDSILHPKYTNTFWSAILIFSRQYEQKMFRSSFDDFSGPGTTRLGNVENNPKWLSLVPETYPHFFGVQLLPFPISTAKQCFSPISTIFSGQCTTRANPEKAKLITGLRWPGFAPETYPHCLGCNSYRLSLVLLKIVLVEFRRLFRDRSPLE